MGDEVYFEDGSAHKITEMDVNEFTAGGLSFWGQSKSGKDGGRQIAFHAPPNLVPSNADAFKVPQHIAERKKGVDWSQVPIDTLVEVFVNYKWKPRYFAGWKSGTPTYFAYGATSKTSDELGWSTVQLSKIRLADGGAE